MGGYGSRYGAPAFGFETLGAPPELQNQDPAPNDIDVSRNSNIILEVSDTLAGVDIDTTIIRINGEICWQDDGPTDRYTGTRTSITDGYKYEINPKVFLPNNLLVNVNVYCESLSGGTLDEQYSFTTVSEIIPIEFTVDMQTSDTIRITFNDLVDNNANLIDLSNWVLDPIGPGVNANLINPSPENAQPLVYYIEFNTDRELTIADYQITITENEISANSGENYLVSPYNVETFTAINDKPYVVKTTAIDMKQIELEFSNDMDGTKALTNKTSYTINGGLTVSKVVHIASKKVILYLNEPMVPNQLYEITVVG